MLLVGQKAVINSVLLALTQHIFTKHNFYKSVRGTRNYKYTIKTLKTSLVPGIGTITVKL